VDTRGLAEGFARWPAGQDALIDAVQCVILAHWQPRGGDPPSELDDEGIAELYRVFHNLTGWTPTEAQKAAARDVATMKAEEFDQAFDHGEDVSPALDLAAAQRPGKSSPPSPDPGPPSG
jgi:hypothetical protein